MSLSFPSSTMDSSDWDCVLQYITDPAEFASNQSDPLADADIQVHPQQHTPGQVLTPPVRISPLGSPSRSPCPPPQTSDPSSPRDLQDSVPQDHVPGNTIVSVSTTFHPGASLLPSPPDLIFLSSDCVFFYVHTTQVLAMSVNYWNDLVPPKPTKTKALEDLGPVVALPETANVLNVILHIVYELSCAHYHPAIDTLIYAVDAMATYGLPPKQYIAPSTPLYSLILNQAPMQPIIAYALAAAHDIYDLAVPVSSHLLSYTLHTLTDEIAMRIGPVYMKRLFFLHLGRLDALKRLLLPPPHPHPPTPNCDFTEQKKLTRAWALASAYLAWDARPGTHLVLTFTASRTRRVMTHPCTHVVRAVRRVSLADLSTRAMESALCPLADHLSCEVCKQSLADRVKQLIVQWSVVKVSLTSRAAAPYVCVC